MRWPQGHEKIISFGVAIKVDGKAAGVWCYSAELKEDCAVYRGIPMTWEEWSPHIMAALDFHKSMGESKSQLFKCGLLNLYFQKGRYLTLPKQEHDTVVEWIYHYIKDGRAPFPYSGDMGSDNYQFTIDFDSDVEIVPNYAIKNDMAAYNRAANTDKGRRRVVKRFADLKGDRWTTAELKAQGFSKDNIKAFVNNDLIKRLYQGHYIRNSK